MTDGQTFYDEDEAETILRLAARHSGLEGGMTRERLLATAEELGISPAAVEAAEREIRGAREVDALRKEYEAEVRRGHWSEVSSWLRGSVVLFGINLIIEGFQLGPLADFWCVWPIGIWGFVLVGRMIERAVTHRVAGEERFQQWRARRERRKARGAGHGLERRVETLVEDALEDALPPLESMDGQVRPGS